MSRVLPRVISYLLTMFVVSTGVSAQNVDEMAKWTALTAVHYRLLGEYSGDTQLIGATTVPVTDRVEIEFDWDQFEMKLAGPAKITNTTTRHAAPVGVGGRAVPTVTGTLEILTVTAVSSEQIPGMLMIATTSDTPGGQYQGMSERGPCAATYDVTAATKSAEMPMQVMPAMMLAMAPPGTGGISPDGKSFIVNSQNWTWTWTPTPVR